MNVFKQSHLIRNGLLICTIIAIFTTGLLHFESTRSTAIRFVSRDQVLANWAAIIAEDKHFWTDEGVQIEYQRVVRGRDAAQALIAGESDITVMSDFSFMLASHHHDDIRLFASIAQSSNSVILIGDATVGVRTLEDIRGKSVALSVGSGTQFYVEELLDAIQIPIQSVKILNLEPEALVQAARRHESAVLATWQPYSHQVEKILGTNAIILPEPSNMDPYQMTFDLVSHDSFLTQHSQDVRRFLKALKRAEIFIATNRQEAISIYSRRTGMNSNDIIKMASQYSFDLLIPDKSIAATLKRQDQWAAKAGLVSEPIAPRSWQTLIDQSHFAP